MPEEYDKVYFQFDKSGETKRGEPKSSSKTLCFVYVLLNYELNCLNASFRQHLYHINALIH